MDLDFLDDDGDNDGNDDDDSDNDGNDDDNDD